MRIYFQCYRIDSRMYEFNLTPTTRKEIDNLFAKYIDPDDTEINIDEIEINETFIAIVVDSGVLAVKYTIENGQVVAKMSPTFEGNTAVENLTNTFITNGLQKFVVERMNLNGGKRSTKRGTKRSSKRSSKRSKRRTRKA